MRILVIESDPVTADVIEHTFPKEHEVVVFGSGRAALERIAIGPLRIGGLAVGSWRSLTPSELAQLRE